MVFGLCTSLLGLIILTVESVLIGMATPLICLLIAVNAFWLGLMLGMICERRLKL